MKTSLPVEENRHPGTGSTESQIRQVQKRNTPRHIVIKIAKFKDEQRMLKTARERAQFTFKKHPWDY